jgi:hypothetical protein
MSAIIPRLATMAGYHGQHVRAQPGHACA